MNNLNVKEIRKKLGVTQEEFAELLGVSRNTVLNYEKGENIPSSKSTILRKLLRLSEEKNINSTNVSLKEKLIPRVEIEVVGGNGNNVFGFTENDVKEYYKIPLFDKLKIDFLVSLSGSSMQPKYNSGDILGCKTIIEHTFIEWNKPHVIATKSRGMLFKRIKKGSSEDTLLLVSENPEYDPFEVPKDEITGLAIVVGYISIV